MSNLPIITKEAMTAAQQVLTRDFKKKNDMQKTEDALDMVARLSENNPLLQFLISTLSANTKDPTSAMIACYALLNVIDQQLGAKKLEAECNGNGTDSQD
jgi:hypothetical protein